MWNSEVLHGATVLRRAEASPTASVLNPVSPWADLDQRMGPAPSGRYIIDVSSERFLTSEALAVLVGLVRRVQQCGGRLAFAGAQPSVTGVLDSMRLSRLVPVTEDVPAALAAVSA